ncbi:MAG: glutamate--tRNA ligase family protein, partial [Hyphomicrobiales bacterium]|nr:glutamate--tRNA ligase family protein [Hyphomicrobiales bacterium]
SLSDPVLRREDGHYLYMLPSVVDDIAMNITHVVRGADHLTNTAVQLCLIEALEGDAPAFAHHSLLLDEDGSKLSKRLEGLSLSQLRSGGIEPAALTSLLARLGSSENPKLMYSMEELTENFSLSNFSKAPVRFDTATLEALNSKLLHEMDFADAQPRLKALGVGGDENFWNGIRGNLTRFDDVLEWWQCVAEPLDPAIDAAEDGALLAAAQDSLPPEPWGKGTYDEWTAEIKRVTGRSGRKLFLPLRLALTGKSHGPELQVLLLLLGRSKASARLSGKRA